MIDDRELALIAAFRLHEVASRLSVLSRVARWPALREMLQGLSQQLAEQERSLSGIAQALPSAGRAGRQSDSQGS
jgi:hypothetical protein